jgi:hypothetical protein
MLKLAPLWLPLAFSACEPQVIDAVDAVQGGASPAGGFGASAAGTSGSGGASGCTGATCCDPNADRDGDGVDDCDDGCPDAPDKTAPGLCGCEFPDTDNGTGVASCATLIASLVHRYTFDGTGTAVHDTKGGPDGYVVGATLTGMGTVTLAGHMTDQYVDLPNGLLSSLTSATLEAWLTWYGGYEWQRIFDFGDDQSEIEGNRSSGLTYLFLTPRITDDGGALVRVAYQRTAYPEVQLDATRTLPAGKLTHVAVTFDASSTTLAVYIDGGFENSKVVQNVPLELSAIHDINDWLGRSQYAADPELAATLEEFRIYSQALNAAELRTSFEAGPNPTFFATP